MKTYITFLLVLIWISSFSQNEAKIWYFGNGAGLDFNGGLPVALTDGVINTLEGCSSISDASGNLLFYTDGITVWDKNHNVMTNGTGLHGHFSSSQSALIVPQPGNDSIFFVFTVDGTENSLYYGVNYSIVNIQHFSGLGEVIVKNNVLIAPATEKITAVMHKNNEDVWIITHGWNSDCFYSYLLTDSNLITTPIISSCGIVHNGGPGLSRGCMKASPDGRKLALNMAQIYRMTQLFDFDNNNGIISNAITLDSLNGFPYGIEFSANSSVLYIGDWSSANSTDYIKQFNLISSTPIDIINSKLIVGSLTVTSDTGNAGSFQLGPDGRIYIAKTNNSNLAIINHPNTVGPSCDFDSIGISLNSGISQLGLPNFITSYFNKIDEITRLTNYNEERIYFTENPLRNSTKLIFENSKGVEHTLQIYNILGRIIKTISNISSNEILITREGLLSGLYFFSLSKNKEICATGKLMVE
jgi:hypothetical protein